MQIIDIAICIDNIDPKGIGRIRYRPYSLYMSEISLGTNYKDWDENDPFIAIPFLPHHINIVPQIEQSVKLIRYDTAKQTQNIEYIAGPYSSPHDMQNQTFTAQHKGTTYGGVIVKDTKDIRTPEGNFNPPTTKGTMVNERDTGFRGNYGSDVIFTENGIQIRGGMLKAKQGNRKESILNYPQLAKKLGRFSLKKFGKTLKSTQETTVEETISVARLKYVIEYELDSLTTPTELRLYVYRVLPVYGEQFNTDVFTDDTLFNSGDTNLVKLINTGNTTTDATHIESLDGTLKNGYVALRDLLYRIDNKGLTDLDPSYPDDIRFPFFYRPTTAFKLDTNNPSNKETFFRKVQVRNKVGSSGLIYSKQSADPPIVEKEKTITVAKEVTNGGEQSFSNLSADKVYITSTSANTGVNVKKIDFEDLDEYELTQDDYVNKIEPNTYAMVRGENLYNLLVAMKNLMDSHIHNINEPLVQTDPNWVKLNELIETMRNDLLNDSIRIN